LAVGDEEQTANAPDSATCICCILSIGHAPTEKKTRLNGGLFPEKEIGFFPFTLE